MLDATSTTYLDDASSVLSHGPVHSPALPRAPHGLHPQQVFLGTLHQVLMLNAHPSQDHPVWGVVTAHVRVQQVPVDFVRVFHGAEPVQSHCVVSEGCLKGNRHIKVTKITSFFPVPLSEPLFALELSPPLRKEKLSIIGFFLKFALGSSTCGECWISEWRDSWILPSQKPNNKKICF